MRVIQTVSSIWNESAGTSQSAPGLCRGLTAAGAEVTLHALDYHTQINPPYEIKIHPRWNFPTKALAYSPQMLAGLREDCRSADIIHANGCWQMTCIYANRARKGTNCKLVICPRGMISQVALQRSRWKKAIVGTLGQWRALREADMFHAASEKEYAEIRALGLHQPVAIIPNGLDLPQINQTIKQSNNQTNKKIVFFGRVHKTKGVDKLLAAWKMVHAVLPDWCVDIIGPDCGVMPELKGFVSENKLPRVTFVGELKGQAKYDALAAADLYVLPSETENFGITIAEALACGTPVIASKGCPWPGLVDHKCGWWIDNTPDALATTIREAVKQDLSEMGVRGREWIAADYSWNGIGKKMIAAYQWLLANTNKPECVQIHF